MGNDPGASQPKSVMAMLGWSERPLPSAVAERKRTPVPQRPRDRIVPLRVLGLGLPRTGTSSLSEALRELGYGDVHHMTSIMAPNGEAEEFLRAMKAKFEGQGRELEREEWEALIGHCEAVTDYPCSLFSEELLEMYPDAKVILTVRDSPEVWHKSVLESIWNTYATRWHNQPGLLAAVQRMLYTVSAGEQLRTFFFEKLWGGPEWFPEHGKEIYIKHNELMKKLVPSEKLLVFNAKEGWEPLCRFLDMPVPAKEFPRVNEGVMMRELVRRYDAASWQKTRSKAIKGSLVVGALVAFATWFYYT